MAAAKAFAATLDDGDDSCVGGGNEVSRKVRAREAEVAEADELLPGVEARVGGSDAEEGERGAEAV